MNECSRGHRFYGMVTCFNACLSTTESSAFTFFLLGAKLYNLYDMIGQQLDNIFREAKRREHFGPYQSTENFAFLHSSFYH